MNHVLFAFGLAVSLLALGIGVVATHAHLAAKRFRKPFAATELMPARRFWAYCPRTKQWWVFQGDGGHEMGPYKTATEARSSLEMLNTLDETAAMLALECNRLLIRKD